MGPRARSSTGHSRGLGLGLTEKSAMLKVTAFPFAAILMILACQCFLFEDQFNKQSLAFHVEGEICNGIHLPRSSSLSRDWIKPFAMNTGRRCAGSSKRTTVPLHEMKTGWGWGWDTIFRVILDPAYIALTRKTFLQKDDPEPAVLRTLKGGPVHTQSSRM